MGRAGVGEGRGRGRGVAPCGCSSFAARQRSLDPHSSCAYVLTTPACGPRSGRLPYTRAWFCRTPGPATTAAAALAATAWGAGLAWVMAVVAGAFLVPAVAYAAAALRVPPALAGVTLLAFAGGAPDLFTEVAAVLASSGDARNPAGPGVRGPPTTADDVGLAVATALGSGLATLCGGLAVVGLAGRADAAPVPAFPDRRAFFRDAATYAAASATLAGFLWNGRFAAGEAGGLLALYALYIGASVWGARGSGGGGNGEGGAAAAVPTATTAAAAAVAGPDSVVVHPPSSPPGGVQLSVFARGAGAGTLPPSGSTGPATLVVSSPRAPPLTGVAAAPPAPPGPGGLGRRVTPPVLPPSTPASPPRAGLAPPPPTRAESTRRTGSGGGGVFGWGGGGPQGPASPMAAPPSELGPLLAAADWDGPPAAAKHRGRSSAGGWDGWGEGARAGSGSALASAAAALGCPHPPQEWARAVGGWAARHWPAPPHWHPAARAVGGAVLAPLLLALHATTPCLAGGNGLDLAAHDTHDAHAAAPTYTFLYAAVLSLAAPPAALAFLGAAPGGRHAAWWTPPAFYGAWAGGAVLLGGLLSAPLARAGWARPAPRANPAMAILALFASSAWLSASADEAVELVRWLGRAAGWRAESIGGALLSWGEALPELAAAASLAASGQPAMALSSAFGGPIFDVCVGLAVPALAAAGRDRQSLGAPLTRGLALLVGATLAVLAGLALAVPAQGYRVGRGLGLCVAGAYVASQAAFAVVEAAG